MSHSCCVYRYVVGIFLLGLTLGLVADSMAQQVLPAPLGGPTGSMSTPSGVPLASPGLSGQPATTIPPEGGSITLRGVITPVLPGRPGVGRAVPIPPQTPGAAGAAPRAPTRPTPELAGQAGGAPTATRVEELSPLERLMAGSTTDPNALLRQFGYDLFTQAPTTFAPVMDVPVGPDYVLGPGDNLNILLWGGVQDTYQVEVDRNGAIALPRLGLVQVWGLTLDQVQRLLQQRFSEFYSDFHMAVTLGQLRTILVYVVGEVQQPGAYSISALSTMVNALFASGGPTKNGSLRHIQLVRQGRVIHTLDLYSFLLQGNKSQDQTVQPGDTILVPLIGPAAGVAGNVKRPAIYEIEPETTLRRLLELAGGVTPLGYLQRVQVERAVANEKKIIVDFDLQTSQRQITRGDVWQTRILDGDLVRVFSIVTALDIANFVQLEGHAVRPGMYELKPGMHLHDLIPSYEVLLPEPYLDYAEIVRYIGPDLRRTIVPFNLGAMLAGDTTQNLVLYPRDIVRLFARADFVDPPQVQVSGLIHRPGIYPLTEGMRLSDLLLRAGNVLKFAYLERAELTRRRIDQPGAAAIRVEIDLTKALEGDPEHNLPLQDFDHLVVRQIPGIELQREIDVVSERRAAAEQQRGAALVDQGRAAAEQQRGVPLVDQGRTPRLYPIVENDTRAVAALRRAGRFIEPSVEIRGEIRFPGNYPILKGERLSSVLRRAGGFTENAYLRGAVFTRERAREEQTRRLQELIREQEVSLISQTSAGAQTALSAEEVQAQKQTFEQQRLLLDRLKAVEPEGRLIIRLGPLETFTGSVQDIELEAGDRLIIPAAPKYVNVLGEVYNRAALIYEPQRPIGYYLDKVGGLKPDADTKQVYLVQLDGTVLSNTQSQYAVVLPNGQTLRFKDFFMVQPQPGDSIVVPRRIVTAATLRNIRDIVQIIFQSVSSLGVVVALLATL